MFLEVLLWSLGAALAHVLCGLGLAYALGRKWESVHRWYEKAALWVGTFVASLSMVGAYYVVLIPMLLSVFGLAENGKIVMGIQWTFAMAGVSLGAMVLIRGMYEAMVPWNEGMPELFKSTAKPRGEFLKNVTFVIVGPFLYLGAIALMQGQKDADEDRRHGRN